MRARVPTGWTKIRVTKLHSFRSTRLGKEVRLHWADEATYTEGNIDWVCRKVGESWFKTDEYEYNGR